MVLALCICTNEWITRERSMDQTNNSRSFQLAAVLTIVGFAMVGSTGCQVSVSGQTLPSPYYLQDDVQYFPAGPEFKLPREAAALKAARAEEKLRGR